MSKFIAVITSSKIVARYLARSLSVTCEVPVKCYHQYREMVTDILTGEVAGIIRVGDFGEREVRTEQIIRHDLKNIDGWNYEQAEEYILPRIVDMPQPILLANIIHFINDLIQEEPPIMKAAPESFDFGTTLIELRGQMAIPSQMISVAVIDDRPEEVAGIMQILATWPNIHIVDYSGVRIEWADSIAAQVMQETPEPNIVLLDEDIGDRVKGSDVFDSISVNRLFGEIPLVASITGGQTPDWATYHFDDKTKIESIRECAEQFIAFMNLLISNLPQS